MGSFGASSDLFISKDGNVSIQSRYCMGRLDGKVTGVVTIFFIQSDLAEDLKVGSDRLIKVPSSFSVLPSPSNSSQKSPNAWLNSAGAADADQNIHVGKNCEQIIQEKNNSSTYYPRFNQQCYTENPEVSLTLREVGGKNINVNKRPSYGNGNGRGFTANLCAKRAAKGGNMNQTMHRNFWKPSTAYRYKHFLRKGSQSGTASNSNCVCIECKERLFSFEDNMMHTDVHGLTNVCMVCSKSFHQVSNLKRHFMCHIQKRSFICALCPSSYSRQDNLASHVQSKHHITMMQNQQYLQGQREAMGVLSTSEQDLRPNANLSVQSLPIDVNQKQSEQGAASNQNFYETADNSSVALPVVKSENVSNSCPFPSLQACPSNTEEGKSCSCCICGMDFQGSKALDEHVLIYHGNELSGNSSMEYASESPYFESKDNSDDASANKSKTESEDEQVFTKKIKIEPDDYNELLYGASYDESVTNHASAKTNTGSHYSGDSFPRTIDLNIDLGQTRMSHGPVIETSSAMEHDNNSHVAPSNSNLDLSSQSIATRFSPDNSHMYITQASRLVSHPVSSNQSPSLPPSKPMNITVNPQELSCYLCSERFCHMTQILDHITCHQGEVPKKCTCMACGAFFTNRDSMKRHISNVHLGIKYQCSYCSVYFTRTDNLRKHIREVHGVRFMKQ